MSTRSSPGNGRNGDLLVCGSCGQVKGQVPDSAATQLCRCAPVEAHRAQPRYGRDFARWVDLCHCCGLDTVPSGSKWSPYHCRRCGTWVRALNGLIGRCVVPIGRHSLMNGVSLSDPVGRPEEAYVAFADQLQAFVANTVEMEAWAAKIALAHLVALGHEPGNDIPLDVYLRKARERRLRPDDAFGLLVADAFPDCDCTEVVRWCLSHTPPPESPPPTSEEEAAVRAWVKALYEATR